MRVIHAKRGVRFQRGVVDLTSNCSIKYKLLTNKRTSDKPLKNCHCDAFLWFKGNRMSCVRIGSKSHKNSHNFVMSYSYMVLSYSYLFISTIVPVEIRNYCWVISVFGQ